MEELLNNVTFQGLLLGIVVGVLIAFGFGIKSRKVLRTEREIWRKKEDELNNNFKQQRRALQVLLDANADAFANLNAKIKMLEENCSMLKETVGGLKSVDPSKALWTLSIYQAAVDKLMHHPGFGPFWQHAKDDAEEKMREVGTGKAPIPLPELSDSPEVETVGPIKNGLFGLPWGKKKADQMALPDSKKSMHQEE